MDKELSLDDFDFDLPEELIALHPVKNRDSSRLMVVDRRNNSIRIKNFSDVVDYFDEDDLIIMNDSKVVNARLRLTRETGGKLEFLLLEHSDDFSEWVGICNRTKKIKEGEILSGEQNIKGEVISKTDGKITLRFNNPLDFDILTKVGEIPLPPYIANRRALDDSDIIRYQTVYSKKLGSLASPTAGLHFTNRVIDKLKAKGVNIAFITLHVSAGTFLPIKTKNIKEHKMHKEEYFIDEKTSNLINSFLENSNKHITCVGTTSIRTLESELLKNKKKRIISGNKFTDLYIYPGFNFIGADRLITNFHTPKSTLLLLVSAFAGVDLIKKAYAIAIKERMRFYSYGDSMIIL